MKVYSKCCVRHDIHNIIVFGTTIPASDIFGPKRRYASAKDLRSDQKHGDLISLNARNGKLDFWKETSTSVQNHLSILHHHNDKQPHLMHLKLSLMRSMIVKAIDLEHVQVMRDVVLTQPLRHQVYDTHALVISQPIILSTVLKATVQDFVRSNSFIAFKNALSTELHYLFGICRPTVSRIYTSTIEMFKLIVSAMRPVRRSIPSNIKENINTTVTIFNEKAKILTTPSKLWVILRGGDLKKKKKKEMAAHMPAQEEKSISLQHATRHSEPLDIPSAALTLVNKSNPLEVVRSHFQIYSKCCTRHDIQNILAIGTEYPASAAFTSSSSHSSSASTANNYSIHSLKDDTTHRPFNATAKYDRNKQFREHSSLQVMLANRTASREKPVEPITESHLLPAAREPLASLQPVGRRLEIKGMQNETKFSNEMQTASNVSTRVLLPNTTTEIENSRHRQEPSSMRLSQHGIHVDEQKKDVSKEVLNRSGPTAEQTIERNVPSGYQSHNDREQNDSISNPHVSELKKKNQDLQTELDKANEVLRIQSEREKQSLAESEHTIDYLQNQLKRKNQILLERQAESEHTIDYLQNQLKRQAESECTIERKQRENQILLERQEELASRLADHEREIWRLRERLQRVETQYATLAERRQPLEAVEITPWNVPRGDIPVDLSQEIGRGGWGVVLRTTYRGNVVAVKIPHQNILNQRLLKRLKRETRIMIQVQHPNLVRIIAAVFDEDANRLRRPPLIITELLDINLRECYLQGRLQPHTRIRVLLDVAYGLHYLHDRQDPIIHRDVSAPNVLLKALPNGMWWAKLSDLGSANLARLSVTPGEGALLYIAPEVTPQLDSAEYVPHTVKIDVYSYGILLLEVIIAEQPDPQLYQ